ncbi:hypothetical protein [Paenibacillus campi]|uniref:hypothetical protein n=1 Tax=Paenibacillus campi TaxID=3106031 RepID=UPI002AFE834C|nr:hypothetical protein [Paenibacillus sp. SGZ-1009]
MFQWINNLYEEIYIHIEVLKELQVASVKKKVEHFIDSGQWMLFDPQEETYVPTEELYDLYLIYLRDIREAFAQLDVKKELQGRPLKNTNDLGEIHSLAAAMLLSAGIICSNDFDIREVIEDAAIYITQDDEDTESVFMQQDTLEDFCYFVINYGVAEKSTVRKFFKAIQPQHISRLDRRLT